MNIKKAQSDQLSQSLYLLKIYTSILIDLLEGVAGGLLNVSDPTLNKYYIFLRNEIDSIIALNTSPFKELKKEEPTLPVSLVGDISEIDIDWQLGIKQNLYDFYGKVENYFIKNGGKEYELPQNTILLLSELDDVIKKHKIRNVNVEDYYRSKSKKYKQEKVFTCGDLLLNLKETKVIFKKYNPVPIQPHNQEIIMLKMLMERKGKVVENKQVAYEIGLASPNQNKENEDFADDIKHIKRKVVKILEKAGMTKKEIDTMIGSRRNIGYILQDN